MRGVSLRNHDTGVAIPWIAALLLAAALPAGGCADQACTLIGWDEGLTLHLTPTPMPAGDYVFDVVADGEPISIEVAITASGSTCDTEDCTREVDLDDGSTLRLRFAGDRLVIATVGGGASGGPAEAAVTVRRDDVEVATDLFTPDYTREEINGSGCGWATTAEDDLAVRSPG
jgi:hypothetical protein